LEDNELREVDDEGELEDLELQHRLRLLELELWLLRLMLCPLEYELSLFEDEETELQDEEVLLLADEQLEQEGLLLTLLDDIQLEEDEIEENNKQLHEQLEVVENSDELQLDEQ